MMRHKQIVISILMILLGIMPVAGVAQSPDSQPNQIPPTPPPGGLTPPALTQPPRPDGSVIHTVVPDDTFQTILVAYDQIYDIITMESVMQLNGWRYEPDFIYLGDEIMILPPGSVDPNTGALNINTAPTTANDPNAQPAQPAGGQAAAQPAQPAQPADGQAAAPAQPAGGQAAPVAPLATEAQPLTPEMAPVITTADIAAQSAVEPITPFLPQ